MDLLNEAHRIIQEMIAKDNQNLVLLIYGSVINGLMGMDSKNGSDLDLTVIDMAKGDKKEKTPLKKIEKSIK